MSEAVHQSRPSAPHRRTAPARSGDTYTCVTWVRCALPGRRALCRSSMNVIPHIRNAGFELPPGVHRRGGLGGWGPRRWWGGSSAGWAGVLGARAMMALLVGGAKRRISSLVLAVALAALALPVGAPPAWA